MRQYCARGSVNVEFSKLHFETRSWDKTSAMIATAISAGVAAPIFNPTGPWMRPI
jgi:hypothetical protein